MRLSLQDKQAEIENANVAAAWRRPESVIIDRPDWFQVTTPTGKQFWHNGIVRSILSDEEAPSRIAETVAHYRAAGLSFRWTVGPSARPARLGQLLEQAGFKPFPLAYGMVGEVDRLDVRGGPDTRIEPVTLANVGDYAAATSLGWGNSDEVRKDILRDMTRSIEDPAHRMRYFVGYYRDQPAASGALFPLERSGYLVGSSVAPAFRGKGVYRALVAARLAYLKERGVPLATIQALSTTSAPICERLGFEKVCEVRAYVYEVTGA